MSQAGPGGESDPTLRYDNPSGGSDSLFCNLSCPQQLSWLLASSLSSSPFLPLGGTPTSHGPFPGPWTTLPHPHAQTKPPRGPHPMLQFKSPTTFLARCTATLPPIPASLFSIVATASPPPYVSATITVRRAGPGGESDPALPESNPSGRSGG